VGQEAGGRKRRRKEIGEERGRFLEKGSREWGMRRCPGRKGRGGII
jgi:hypothetical protein